MKTRLLLLLLCITVSGFGQEDAWVFFTDKVNVDAAIADPISILTQKAIDRKQMHSISIDQRDVPVNESYITQVKSQTGITVLAKSKWMNCIHVRGSQDAIEALSDLEFVSEIDFADHSLNRSTSDFTFFKEDPVLPQTRADFVYGATDNQVTMLNVDELHRQDYTGEGITIAIMDSGFPGVASNTSFSRLRDAGKLLDGYDFVARQEDEFAFRNSDHGTRVASDIVGFVQDQFVGTAPDASIYCFRTEDTSSENPVEESYWVEAAERADSLGVDIINTSLGYRTFQDDRYSYTYEDMDGETAFISRGATLAFQKGMLVVTSAGNSGTGMISAPADAVGSLTVGAVDGDGNYASFSSIGPSSDGRVKPDVVAKGRASAVINQSNTITTSNGTSFSSPIMAGAIASLWQANRGRSNSNLMNIIRASGGTFDTPSPQLGYGIPDFGDALGATLNVDDLAFAKAYTIQPNPASQSAVIMLPEGVAAVSVTIFDILGKKVGEVSSQTSVTNLPIAGLKKGVYLVQINDGTSITTQKLIKS